MDVEEWQAGHPWIYGWPGSTAGPEHILRYVAFRELCVILYLTSRCMRPEGPRQLPKRRVFLQIDLVPSLTGLASPSGVRELFVHRLHDLFLEVLGRIVEFGGLLFLY